MDFEPTMPSKPPSITTSEHYPSLISPTDFGEEAKDFDFGSTKGPSLSVLLQEFSQMLSVDQAYDQVMKNLGTISQSDFSVDTAERINGQLGRSAGEFLADLPLPESRQ